MADRGRIIQGQEAALSGFRSASSGTSFRGTGQRWSERGGLSAVGFGTGIVVAGPIVDVRLPMAVRLPMIGRTVAALEPRCCARVSAAQSGSSSRSPARLLSTWLVALLLGLSHGHLGPVIPRVLALLVVVVPFAAAWVLVQVRSHVPLIDMDMMRRRGVWTTNVVAAFVGFGMFAFSGSCRNSRDGPETGYGFGSTMTQSGRLLLPSAWPPLRSDSRPRRWCALRSENCHRHRLLVRSAAFTSTALWDDATRLLYASTTLQASGRPGGSSLAGVVIASVPSDETGSRVDGMSTSGRLGAP